MTTTTTTPRKIAPPIPQAIAGLPWVANTSLIIGGVLYQRGCVVPDGILNACPNRDALIENRRVRQSAKPVEAIKPVAIDTPQPELRLANVVVADVSEGDFLERWQLSVVLTMVASNCGEVTAKDLLCGDHKGSELFRQATRLASERNAVAKRLSGFRPAVTI